MPSTKSVLSRFTPAERRRIRTMYKNGAGLEGCREAVPFRCPISSIKIVLREGKIPLQPKGRYSMIRRCPCCRETIQSASALLRHFKNCPDFVKSQSDIGR